MMNFKLLLAGLLVLCIITVSGQGYYLKTIQNDTKSVQELQSDGFMKVNTDGRLQGTDKESLPETILKSAVVKQRLDSMISGTSKYEYIYDGNELQNECNHYIRRDNLWRLHMNWKYFYDKSGKISRMINSWYGATPGWVHEWSYFYNADGKVTKSTFDSQGLLEFTWDTNGNLTKITCNPPGDFNIDIRAYDARGNLTEVTAYSISEAIVWQYKFIYDNDDKIIQENIYDLATGLDTVYYSYDVNDNLIAKTSYWWHGNNREVNEKREYTYDNLYSFSDLILPVCILGSFLYPGETGNNIYFKHKLLSYKTITAGGWQSSVKYYYSDFPSGKSTTSSNEIKNEVISLYPNPVSDKLCFNIRDNYSRVIFQLFDIRGTKVMEREITDNQCLNMNDLAAGMYVYNTFTEKGRQSGRLIKN